MKIEIERKFLVCGDDWRKLGTTTKIRQGYIARSKNSTVRIRKTDTCCHITIKGTTTDGICRPEFEYEISPEDAETMLNTLTIGSIIDKNRTIITVGDHTWEIDEFFGDNTGLIVAEIELASADEWFEKPHWIGKEVTFESRFTNASLSRYPYTRWTDDEKYRLSLPCSCLTQFNNV